MSACQREYWSATAEAAIRQCILDGLSAAQTAKQLTEKFHRTFSRGMCLAKGWRMVQDGELEHSFNSQKKRTAEPASTHQPPAIFILSRAICFKLNWLAPHIYNRPLTPHVILPKPADCSRPVTLLEATALMCHWPVSDDPALGELFMVCGNRVKVGQSYCEECLGFAFTKGTRRKR